MAFNALAEQRQPTLLEQILADDNANAATPRDAREKALETALLPMASTPINRYWRIDYARLDLAIDLPRPLLHPQYKLSDSLAEQGVIFCSVSQAAKHHPELLARGLNALVSQTESRFTALATALEQGGYFVYVPAGVVLKEPLDIPVAVPCAAAWFPRHVVIVEAGAQATIYETLRSAQTPAHAPEAPVTLVCGTTEVILGKAAHCRMVLRQTLERSARIFMTRRASVSTDAVMEWAAAELGAGLVKSVIDVRLIEPGARGESTAVFFPQDQQYIDLTNEVDHRVPNTLSHTVVKAAASHNGQGRYYGNIRIRPQAHGSEAFLRDDTLLLGKEAHIDAIPALEIAANNVRAFHGATVGSIDLEQRFYAASRGIVPDEVERMITLGFFELAIERFPSEHLREELRLELTERMQSGDVH